MSKDSERGALNDVKAPPLTVSAVLGENGHMTVQRMSDMHERVSPVS